MDEHIEAALMRAGAQIAGLQSELAALRAQIERLTKALTRLGSVEAFGLPRIIDKDRDAELLARIDFARAAITATKETTK